MKDKEIYKCLKCGGKNFLLQFRTYEEYEEEFHGEYLSFVCSYCDSNAFATEVDQDVFKHIEKEYIKDELGIKDKKVDID